MPDVVISLEQVKQLLAFVCEAVDQANAVFPIYEEDKKQFIFTRWGQICCFPRDCSHPFVLGQDVDGPTVLQSTQILVSHKPHQKHLRRVGSPQLGGRVTNPQEVSHPQSSSLLAQTQRDDGSMRAGYEWLTAMETLLPRLFLRLPKLNMQTNSSETDTEPLIWHTIPKGD